MSPASALVGCAASELSPLAVIRGPVIAGEQRGRQIGFPTANLALDGQQIEFGVYAATVERCPAAVSIGVRPTFGEGLEPLAEAYLLDFDGDLYGRQIEIKLLRRLRDEARFDSTDALVRQIERDVAAVRALLVT